MIFKFAHKIFCAKDLWKKTCTTTWKRYFFSKCITTHSDSDHAVLDLQFQRALGSCQKGLLHYVTLATKLLHVVLFHEDITQLEQKKSSPWYTCNESLHQVLAMLVHYFWRFKHFSERHFYFSLSDFVACSRYLWTTQIHFCQYLRTRWIFVKTLGSSRSFWVPWTLYSE